MPIAQVSNTTNQPTFLHADQLGNVRLLTKAGLPTGTYTYDPYGNATHAGAGTPLQYGGGYTDATRLVYLLTRYYDPNTAQFLTRDPLDAITRNTYGYAEGRPLDLSDPTGLAAVPEPIRPTRPSGYVPMPDLVNQLLTCQISPAEYNERIGPSLDYRSEMLEYHLAMIMVIAALRAEAKKSSLNAFIGECLKGAGQGAVVGFLAGDGVGAIPAGLWGCAQSEFVFDVEHRYGKLPAQVFKTFFDYRTGVN
jgi:RHS repeat-associated protein